jgi:hypothetical protein
MKTSNFIFGGRAGFDLYHVVEQATHLQQATETALGIGVFKVFERLEVRLRLLCRCHATCIAHATQLLLPLNCFPLQKMIF